MITLAIIWIICSLLWLCIAIAYMPTIIALSPLDEIISDIFGFILLIVLGPISIIVCLLMIIVAWTLLSIDKFINWLFGVNKHEENDKNS